MPGTPHALIAVYGFPERGTWRLEPASGRRSERVLVYRFGRRSFLVPAGAYESEELLGRECAIELLQMELRQAALLWPDGQAWTPGRDPDRVELEGLGSLEALGSDAPGARPVAFRSYLPDGEWVESLNEVTWGERDGRSWPVAWTLCTPGGVVWHESIDLVQPGGLYGDRYFVPADRLRGAEARAEDPATLQRIEVPSRIVRRVPLPPGTDWIETLEEAARRMREGTEGGPGEPVDSRLAVELGEDGEPRALELRLVRRTGDPPSGWTRFESSEGLCGFVADPRWIDRPLLDRLRAGTRSGGAPYALIEVGAGPGAQIQVVLPIP